MKKTLKVLNRKAVSAALAAALFLPGAAVPALATAADVQPAPELAESRQAEAPLAPVSPSVPETPQAPASPAIPESPQGQSAAESAAQPSAEAPGPQSAAAKLVHLRDISEAAGAVVTWNEQEFSARVTRGDTEIEVKIGEPFITVNGKAIPLDAPVAIVGEKTVVPLDVLNEALGIQAGWNEEDNAMIIADDDYALRATALIHALNSGNADRAVSFLNDHLKQMIPGQLLLQYWGNYIQLFGEVGKLITANVESNAVHHNATLVYEAANAPITVIVRFDDKGKVDDIFTPAASIAGEYQKPAYDDPSKYTEQEIKIGEGPLALPGTLTLPAGEGPFPAVVLVHGSGPNDRDETMGAVKPFRDLAVGLAAQGIAVLRYEKVTREHNLKVALNPMFTVNEETVDDALRAVKLLQTIDEVDASRIFVAGHSQGGMMIPRIADADKDGSIAGVIVISAPAMPLEDLVVIQLKNQLELAKKAGSPAAAQLEQQVALYEQQVELLKDPQYNASNPPKGFALGNPIWWLDIRNHYTAELLKDQSLPALILQGENDAQVPGSSLEDFKKALSGRTNVEYKLYPKVNHTLVEFEGVSTGAEYALPANVPEYLISDIADWIKRSNP